MSAKKAAPRQQCSTDARVTLTNTASKLAKSVAELLARKDEFDSITAEAIHEIDTKRVAAEQALDEDLAKLDTSKKRKIAELEIDLQHQKRETAVKILEHTHEVPILEEVLDKLKKRCDELEDELDNVKSSVEQSVTDRLNTQHRHELEKLKLENAASMAELTERNKSLNSMIEEKDKIIDSQRKDNVQLQKLVQGVADAGRPNVYNNPYPNKN